MIILLNKKKRKNSAKRKSKKKGDTSVTSSFTLQIMVLSLVACSKLFLEMMLYPTTNPYYKD